MSNTNVTVTEITEEFVTGYKASKILAEQNVTVRPQMIYNYIAKGYIPSVDGKVSTVELAKWAVKYVAKKNASLTK
jgi:hypothetical protein